ncbi:McrC family protein [Amycolatopsis sp. NPDC052450]|uniref:McrC family protein n=1 Tax=Amycolatopsis sp. NPDC052450 TaxID=3363937 RepID=UPI0037C5A43F
MRTLHFHEYRERRDVPLTLAEVTVLRTTFKCLVTRTDNGDGQYNVRAQDRVGMVIVGDTAIVVAPKLPIARVLFLITHAVDPSWTHEAALGTAESLTDAMAAVFTHMCDQAVRTGLLRGYRDHRERLHTVRGRIDFAEQLRVSPGRDLPLAVTYQTHDEDIPENQLLRTALDLLAQVPVESHTVRRSIARQQRMFESVTPVPRNLGSLPVVRWTRLNEHYRPAVELARLILLGTEPELGPGRITVPGFAVRMTEVFEKFVRTSTRRALGLAEHDFPAGADSALHLDHKRALHVQPDLSHWIDGHCRFVGELKYRLDTGHGDAQHLYQTLAYATAANLPDATLIYADGPRNGTTHVLPTAGIRIHVRHLDLNVDLDQLLGQIDALAHHINELTTRPWAQVRPRSR